MSKPTTRASNRFTPARLRLEALEARDVPATVTVNAAANVHAIDPNVYGTAFASTAQAEGVSLPVARRLLAVLLGAATPSVATLGRFSQDAARRSSRLLEVLDAEAASAVTRVTADEIFLARRRS